MSKSNGNHSDRPRRFNDEHVSDHESGIIANLLVDRGLLSDCKGLDGAMFRSERLGAAFDAIATSDDHPVDVLLAAGWKVAHLNKLSDCAISANLTGYYAERIKEAGRVRSLHQSLCVAEQEITSDPYAPAEDHIEQIQVALEGISSGCAEATARPVGAVLSSLFKELEAGDDVLPTGWADVDRLIRGWPLGTLSLVAGRPGMGKSAVLLNAAYRQARAGVPTLFVGLEDRQEQHVRRLLAIEAKESLHKITHEYLATGNDDYLHSSLIRCASQLDKLPLYFLDGPLTSAQVARMAREHIDALKVRAIFVDHAQEILPDEEDRRDQRTYEIQAAAQRLRDVASKTNTAVILAAQINREAEKNKRPMVSHLRDSGALEMVARLVLLLYREEVYDEETDNKGILEVIVGKANHGPAGASVELSWIGERCAVEDLERWRYTGDL